MTGSPSLGPISDTLRPPCTATVWPGRLVRGLAVWLLLVLGIIPCVDGQDGVTVGLYFVESQEVFDPLSIPPFVYHTIDPWQLTGAGTQFVQDGAFAASTEQDVRDDVIAKVKNKFYSVATPTGYALNIDFLPQKVSGSGSVNVLIGQSSAMQWFGWAVIDAALGPINGESMAAVSVDRIDSMLQVDFTQYDHALNAVSNVVAHEVGHMFGLEHVWADDRADLGWQGEPVVTNPYDVLATGPTGLPESGWIEDNIFTTVAGTQAGGGSSASLLIQNVGLRKIGDTDLDGDVDNADIGAAAGSFTGSTASNQAWANGDFDRDGDVDNADIGAAAGNFTGSSASNLIDSGTGPTIADLVYDPSTGNLMLDASEATGGSITSFQLESTGAFLDTNYNGLSDGTFGGLFEDVSDSVLADSDLDFVGFNGLADLGNVLPTGMDLTELEALLSTAVYTGSLSSGQQQLDLTLAAAIPEPTSLALLALGGLLTIGRRRRRG